MSDYSDDFTDDEAVPSTPKHAKKHSAKPPKNPGAAATPGTGGRKKAPSFVPSARTMAFIELQNKLAERDRQLDEVSKELKTLQNIQRRQDKALSQYEDANAELPALIARREEEIRVLTAKVRSQKERLTTAEAEVKKLNKRILEATDDNTRLSALVEDKSLGERSDLSAKVQELETTIREREFRITKLERAVDLEAKNRARAEKALLLADKEANTQVQTLKDAIQSLQEKLTDKERLLAHANVYRGQSSQQIPPQPSTVTKPLAPPMFTPAKSQTISTHQTPPPAAPSPVKSEESLRKSFASETSYTGPSAFITNNAVDEIQEEPDDDAEKERELERERERDGERERVKERERAAEAARQREADRLRQVEHEGKERERRRVEAEAIAEAERARAQREREEHELRVMREENARRDKERIERETAAEVERAKEERRKKDELLARVSGS